MNRDSSGFSGVNLRAVGTGMVWGLGLMLFSTLLQAVAATMAPMSEATVNLLTLVYQGVSALLGGYVAARRASSSGWFHGAAAGAALVLSILAVTGVATALPTLAMLLKILGIGTGMGALGGVFGVNSRDR